jgi:peptidoglycan/LPS O-acetylase OafA/YrhL
MKQNIFQFTETASINLYLLRIIAIHLVILGHGIGIFLQHRIAHYFANMGLVLFFLISGLMISYSIYKKDTNNDYNFKIYLVNRFSRIYPPLIICLILLIIIDGFSFNNPLSYNIPSFLTTLFLLNDTCLHIPSFGSARPLWVLPLFWWTYLFFGWIYLGRKTTKKKFMDILLLCFFSFMMIFVYSGFFCDNLGHTLGLLLIWINGILILVVLKCLYSITNKKIKYNKQNYGGHSRNFNETRR